MSRRLRFGWGLLGALVLVCGLLVGAPGRGEAAASSTGVKQADAGRDQTCYVRTDGSVWCWGDNTLGQLGDGTRVASAVPVQVKNLAGGVQVSTGVYATCAVRTDKSVWCWGWNRYGQLGDGTKIDRLTPVRVKNLSGVTQVAVGTGSACARRSDGSVWCWGWNASGQLGDGTTRWNRLTPVRVKNLSGAVQVSAGALFACARRSDGSVWCWGENAFGELGDGSTTDRRVPVAVKGLPGAVTQVQLGGSRACALRADGTIWCWGSVDGLVATKSVMTGALAVSCGGGFTCALTTSRTVRCWGNNTLGQLGDGTTVSSPTPVTVIGLSNVRGITSAEEHTCAVLYDNTMRCWGAVPPVTLAVSPS